jgi:hypothetical protein
MDRAEKAWKKLGHNHDNDVHERPCGLNCPLGKKRLTDANLKGKKLCSYCHSPKFEWEGYTCESSFANTDHQLKEGMHPCFRLTAICLECQGRDSVLDDVDLITHFAPIVLSAIKELAEN